MRRVLVLLTAVGSLAPATAWAAPDKAACLAAYQETQKLKKAGKLLEAKERSLVCAQVSCPTVVRDDCASWSVELDKNVPTIVLVVTDAEGRDITDAVAYVDGEKITAHVEGKAIALDPGPHKLRVEREGFDTIEQDVIAHEGAKNRTITVKFPKKQADEKPVAPEPIEAPPPVTMTSRPVPTAAWVFTGIGLAGVAGFAAFGLMGSAKKNDLDGRACKPTCPEDDVNAAKRDFLIADVALGVGVVSLGVATVLILTRGEAPSTSTPSVGFAVTPRGANASVAFSF